MAGFDLFRIRPLATGPKNPEATLALGAPSIVAVTTTETDLCRSPNCSLYEVPLCPASGRPSANH